jgi:RNA polymerase Rpb1, domain 3
LYQLSTPQLAVAEAFLIAFTNEQYSAPTDNAPLRGVIQDSVDGGVKMCGRDTFLTKEEFQQLIFQVNHTDMLYDKLICVTSQTSKLVYSLICNTCTNNALAVQIICVNCMLCYDNKCH